MSEETTSQKKPHKHLVPEEVHEHAQAARQELRKSLESLVPPEFIEHRRKARKEMLLAWRSLIDAAIKRLEEK